MELTNKEVQEILMDLSEIKGYLNGFNYPNVHEDAIREINNKEILPKISNLINYLSNHK